MSWKIKEYAVKLKVAKFHRASKFRSVADDWTICDYTVQARCSGCSGIQGFDLENSSELHFKCEECDYEGSMQVVKLPDAPESISTEGVLVTVATILLEGDFILGPNVDIGNIIWKCDIEKKDNPHETVVREFILENGGFIDGQEREDVDIDEEKPGGWEKDDSDRPSVKNVTATLQLMPASIMRVD